MTINARRPMKRYLEKSQEKQKIRSENAIKLTKRDLVDAHQWNAFQCLLTLLLLLLLSK